MAGKQLIQVIAEMRGGLVQVAASQKMDELIKAVQLAGRKGTIAMELTFEPHGEANREMYVTAKITVKSPAHPDLAEPSIFYVNSSGDLVREDPNQSKLPFRTSRASTGPESDQEEQSARDRGRH